MSQIDSQRKGGTDRAEFVGSFSRDDGSKRIKKFHFQRKTPAEVVIIVTAQLDSTGSAQVQILHTGCQRFAMMRIFNNGPG